MPYRQLFFGIALCLLGGATAAQAASAPEGFEAIARQGDRVDIQGVGFGQRGQFRLSDGSAAGAYERSSTSRTWTQGLGDKASSSHVRAKAKLTYTLDDGQEGGPLTAACEARAVSEKIDLGALSIGDDVQPFDLSCVLSRGGRAVGDLDLHAVPPTGLMVQDRREGRIRLGGETLSLTSIHRFEGGRLPTASPLGYLLARDDQVVAAIDVNHWRTRKLALPKSPELREAALAASLVLALQWSTATED